MCDVLISAWFKSAFARIGIRFLTSLAETSRRRCPREPGYPSILLNRRAAAHWPSPDGLAAPTLGPEKRGHAYSSEKLRARRGLKGAVSVVVVSHDRQADSSNQLEKGRRMNNLKPELGGASFLPEISCVVRLLAHLSGLL
jgi:hypothetical protein